MRAAQRESREYAARIEDDLRVRAFDAIQAACQALADALAAERGVSTAFLSREDLTEVYADALALLYRLLFILYAESRELLPAHDPAYTADYSLRELIARLPERPDAAIDSAEAAAIWPRLARLFRALNGEERAASRWARRRSPPRSRGAASRSARRGWRRCRRVTARRGRICSPVRASAS